MNFSRPPPPSSDLQPKILASPLDEKKLENTIWYVLGYVAALEARMAYKYKPELMGIGVLRP